MRIDEIIAETESFKRYADKYNNPYAEYKDFIPSRLLKKFYKQATLDEIALYYYGVFDPFGKRSIVPFLAHLERQGLFTSPIIPGVFTEEYWENWLTDHLIEVMDQGKIFGL